MQIRQSKTLENILTQGVLSTNGNNGCDPVDRIFLILLDEANCHATHILRKLLKDWEIYQIKVRIEQEIENRKQRTEESEDNVALEKFNESLEEICNDCPVRQDPVVNTGHLLLYVIREKRFISSRILELYNLKYEIVREYVMQLPADEDYYVDMHALQNIRTLRIESRLGDNNPEEDTDEENETSTDSFDSRSGSSMAELEKYGVNLTRAAANGEIDPVVGRDKEIERLIQILGRRKKNNPILIGEAGVGKSAIVEGLALRIASRDVPLALLGKTLFSLDVTSLVAGTKYRGQFEERIKALLKILKNNRDIILFIDEIHTIVGAGSTQGSLDTANILKPALARGELQCIGATTLDEFRENIESDSALERRFQKIVVEPTSRQETLRILENIKGHYEHHHAVRYSEEALIACVELTERYITDRHFPDKAIDVLDEAGSKAHVFGMKEPQQIKEIEAALAKATEEKRKAVASLVYEQAAKARIKEMALASKLGELRTDWQRQVRLNPITITAEHIQEVVSSMTGIPISRVSQGEKSRLKEMYAHLNSIVIGQPDAIGKIARSIQRSRAGLKDPGKPIGVFMFVGPTGVGKTLLAKELSKWLFDRSDALVRVDMSEYAERHNISRLIGSPPGYVGYNEGGQLTEIVRRQPYSVVLFDEIEKAHPDVFNVMLQIFDEGQLTDGSGRKIDFRNTVIIMTSNVGSREVAARGSTIGYNTPTRAEFEISGNENRYRSALENTFAPEFINRIDDIIVFNTLTIEDVKRIVDVELQGLYSRAEAMGYRIKVTDKAKAQLAEMSYEPKYGVRSLKRIILERVEEPLAQMIVSEEVHSGDEVDVDFTDDGRIELLAKAV